MISFTEDDLFLVTGATSGIGRSTALLLNKLGAAVIAVGRSEEKMAVTTEEAANPKLFHGLIKDLSQDIDSHHKWLIRTADKYGRIKGMVLAAGIRHTTPLKAISLKKTRQLFDINVFSNLMLAKGFGNAGVYCEKGPAIVFISSIAAFTGGSGIIDYSASKGALAPIVKSLALELSPHCIRVNSILPGFVLTNMIKKDKHLFNENFVDNINKQYPLGIGKPEDVAQLACFLLSNCSSWITGSNIVIDGGASLT